MPSYTDVFGGQNIYPAQLTLLVLNPLTANTTLSWPVEQAIAGTNVFADIIEVTPNAGLAITMPDAQLAGPGQATLVNNVGANTVTIKDNAGNTIGTVASGVVKQFYLEDNSTQAGTWRVFTFGTGASSADAAALAGAGLKAITTTLNVKVAPTLTNVTPTNILDADRAELFVWDGGVGAFNLPDPATVGSDWFVMVRNGGTGTLTVTPAAGTVDGDASLDFRPGDSAIFVTDGSDYFTVGFGQAISSLFDHISINVAGTGDYTLSGDELDRISYEFTGVLTGNRNIIVPASLQQYWVFNNTSGAFTLTVKTLAGTGVAVPQGYGVILYCDGSNVLAAEGATTTAVIPVALGGTGLTTVSQGDLLYASATAVFSRLAKDTNATRYLSNTGGSNNPAWAQVDLSNGVLNRLPFANLTQGAALSVLGVTGNAIADVASIVAAADKNILRRSGTAVAFGTIDLTDTGSVAGASQGDLLYGSAADTWSELAKDAGGLRALFNTGAGNNPQWLLPRMRAQGATNSDYTFAVEDGWSIIPHTGAATQDWTVPANATAAIAIGAMIVLDNRAGAGALTLRAENGVTVDGHGATVTGGGGGSDVFVLPPGYKLVLWKMLSNTWCFLTDAPVTSGQGVLYAGFCDGSAGAGVSITPNSAATGWSVAQAAAGRFTVTHNLGLAAATDLSIVANVRLSAGGTNDRYCNITNETVNSFDVALVDTGTGAVDDDFYFQATRLV